MSPRAADGQPDVIVRVIARLLLGPAVVVAAGLIAKGYAEVGDGFGAGVIVALAIGLTYVALGREDAEAALPVLRHAPTVAVSGLLLALGSGFFSLLRGDPPVTHRPGPGNHVVTVGAVELMTPVLLDVGIFLLVVGVLTVLLHLLALPEDEPAP